MSLPDDGSAVRSSRLSALRPLLKIDIFRVVQDRDQHLTPATERGGWLSAVCVILIVIGVLNESWLFFRRDWRSTMAVSKHSLQMEQVHFNVTFDNFPCAAMEFEAIEANTGRIYEEQQKSAIVWKYRMVNGVNVGKHDSTVTRQNGEGCQVVGTFMIDKVPGHFIITAKHMTGQRPPNDFTIHELWFGAERIAVRDIAEGLANPLGGFRGEKEPVNTLYQFFLNIVPTSFDDGRLGFQYTSTHSHVQADLAPGIYFHHVHSPLSVMYRRNPTTWSHFLTNLCAVAGGVFTVVGFGAAVSAKAMKWFDKEGQQ